MKRPAVLSRKRHKSRPDASKAVRRLNGVYGLPIFFTRVSCMIRTPLH
jgi:hypothetical protein